MTTFAHIAYRAAVLLMLLGLYLPAAGNHQLSRPPTQPDCSRSEDACYPDYRDGTWYVVEGSRP